MASSRNRTQYRIPDNYLIQTSWGRNKSHHMVEYEIEYEQDGPIFIIRFEENAYQYVLESKKFPTTVANDYLQKKCPNTRATISGIHVFGLNIMDVEQEHDRINPMDVEQVSRTFFIHLAKTFNCEVPKFFNSLDHPTLQEIKFNVQDKNYVINYNDNKENRERSLVQFMEIIDWEPISHHAYRKLATIQHELPRAYEISDIGKKINQEMSTKIPIFILNIENIFLELLMLI
ncbi:hypothetical protein C2G38_2182532 [Gigaspora rosea]|uniref:Uncharacterized protein n=1 Tax=Gigaspora rosea TaxID=44941 RepID=A0A397VH31_9GLOM|nr:hypothetical protein C2G38_2182532 [Gigaspora rosea]